jgi:hypothetical protein
LKGNALGLKGNALGRATACMSLGVSPLGGVATPCVVWLFFLGVCLVPQRHKKITQGKALGYLVSKATP